MAIWVFGYGSLVYKPGFAYEEAVQGYIKGFRRVFWQGSTDHRGTREAPGRTVTLTEDPAAVTWGVAYRLAGTAEEQQAALAYLEWREKQYDQRHRAHVFSSSDPEQPVVHDALVYVATAGNVNWLGPARLQDIAAQVARAVGPSGPNREYVFKLSDAMRQMGVEDAELFALEAAVRQHMAAAAAVESSEAAAACMASSKPGGSSVDQPLQMTVVAAGAGSP